MRRSWNTALSVSTEAIFNPAVSRITFCHFVLLFNGEGYFGTLSNSVGGEVRRNLSLTIDPSLGFVCVCVRWGKAHACCWPVAGTENVLFPFISPRCYQALSLRLYLWSLIGSRWQSGTPVQPSYELHIWPTVKEYLKGPCTGVTV